MSLLESVLELLVNFGWGLFGRQSKRTEIRPTEPLHIELQDTEWPFTYTDHDRVVVRAVVVDDGGNYYFNRLERGDMFCHGTVIETAGGGVEDGEEWESAIRRELREELGAEVEILAKIGTVSDYYNLIHRHNINHFYLCRAVSFGEPRMTEDEIHTFHLSTLKLSYDEAVAEYERCRNCPLGRVIAPRELPILHRAKEVLETLK
jgi:8-oxo-dGTP pyrophosphatase MutT (NUDIX family)